MVADQCLSLEAVWQFPGRSIDFVFIYGNQTYQIVKQDVKIFLPKMRDGGLATFNDYYASGESHPGVKKAVYEFSTSTSTR